MYCLAKRMISSLLKWTISLTLVANFFQGIPKIKACVILPVLASFDCKDFNSPRRKSLQTASGNQSGKFPSSKISNWFNKRASTSSNV